MPVLRRPWPISTMPLRRSLPRSPPLLPAMVLTLIMLLLSMVQIVTMKRDRIFLILILPPFPVLLLNLAVVIVQMAFLLLLMLRRVRFLMHGISLPRVIWLKPLNAGLVNNLFGGDFMELLLYFLLLAVCIYPYILVVRLMRLACKALKKYISE